MNWEKLKEAYLMVMNGSARISFEAENVKVQVCRLAQKTIIIDVELTNEVKVNTD